MAKVSKLGERTGYLYDIANEDDKEAIDKILRKYHSEYPLIFVGAKLELASRKEALKLGKLFTNFKESKQQIKQS